MYTKKQILSFLLPVAIILGTTTGCSADIKLVKNGKANCVIVIPEKSTPSQKTAADELKYFIGKVSGAEVSIIDEQSFSGNLTPIYLGSCNATLEAGIDAEALQSEEYLIKATGKAVFLACNNIADLTIRYAVSDFLQSELGIRFLGGGDLWTHIPECKTVKLGTFERKYRPQVAFRRLRNVPYHNSLQGAQILDIDFEQWKEKHPDYAEWHVRMGNGSRMVVKFGHSFDGWWDKYGATHPEYFALQPNGTRTQTNYRERLCVSNPGLWDEVAKVRLAELEGKPKGSMVSLCPNDGSSGNKFCFCPECRKLDPPEGKKISDPNLIDPTTGKAFPSYPSLTDRYLNFYNEVAKRIAKVRPDAKIGVYAYSFYKFPPVRIKKAEPNIVVGVVTMDRDLLHDWSAVASELFHRPNYMNPRFIVALPRNTARYIVDFVRFAISCGVTGFDHDSSKNLFDSQGLEYYILCRAMYNPNIDVEKEIKDYIEKGFGKGAAAMERYFDKLEQISTRMRIDNEVLKTYSHFDQEAVASLRTELDAAKKAIANESSKEYRRVVRIENTVLYAETVNLAYEQITKAGGTQASLDQATKMVYDFCRKHVDDPDANYLLRANYAKMYLPAVRLKTSEALFDDGSVVKTLP